MAAILQDEDLIAQAQERERARLEEEAQILAFQQRQAMPAQAQPPPVTFTNPAGPIEVGVPAGVTLPEMPRQMVGDAQYQLEVDRAQRGSGFVNANVSPTGEVITGAYDPATDPRAIAAEQAATSYKRQQLYGSLLRDGSTAAEAFRFANSRYPDIKSAPGLMRAETALARRAPMQPEIQTVDGVRIMRTGPASFARIPEARPLNTKPPVVPLDTAASQKILTGRITDTRADLARAKKEIETNPDNVDAARRANIYQNQLRELEQQFQTGSTNFMGAAQAPVRTSGANANASAAAAPFKEGATVRNKTNGKLYRVVNGVPVEVKG